MSFNKFSLCLLCCSGYKNDPLIRDFFDIESDDCKTAVSAYSSLCFRLLSSGVTLSDYIFTLAVDCNNPMLETYIKTRDESVLRAIRNDIGILSEIAHVSSEEIISYLVKKFDLYGLSFPVFETGDTEITAEAVISYAERYGSPLFADNKAFVFENNRLLPSEWNDEIMLRDLKNYYTQRQKLIDNTVCFVNGYKAQNALLYGDRGTGKSSTIKAIANEYDSLRIIQIPKSSIMNIVSLYEIISDNPLKFILFIDDITFSENDEGYSFLKQILEGSVVTIPENCVIYATTNRRHIIKETVSERSGDEVHASDARDENMSLADRFGLYITFLAPDKNEYLDIVRQIASDRKIEISDEKLCALAERFALKKCGRSPRTAKQFVDIIQSKAELSMDIENI